MNQADDDLLRSAGAGEKVIHGSALRLGANLANLVFAQRFKRTGSSTTAFGASLLGAIVGGVLEYLSLITGFRFLLVVVAVLYGLAFVFGRRHLTAGA